ncbi:hypothetical_protein [Leishmania major strain Friedlin]|nr:hypothetical_protein [Leishmania major strain Friedlin]
MGAAIFVTRAKLLQPRPGDEGKPTENPVATGGSQCGTPALKDDKRKGAEKRIVYSDGAVALDQTGDAGASDFA